MERPRYPDTEGNWTPFETETCPRCLGSGHHSFCSTWGTTCFKCGVRPHEPGRGSRLTKRGAKAAEFLKALLSRPASEIQAGDLVRLDGRFWRVKTVSPGQPAGNIALNCRGYSYHTPPDTPIRMAATAEQKAEALRRALRYQELLTKTGIERKNKAAQKELETLREVS